LTTATSTQDLAKIFRALGDPSRLAIFELVRECCEEEGGHSTADLRSSVTEIARQFESFPVDGLPPPSRSFGPWV